MAVRYQARWIIPVVGNPVPNGAIEVHAGRITRIFGQAPHDAIDLGPVAILPGLVNAHTHLEFSHFTQPLPTSSRFTDWIRAVVASRRERTAEQTGAAISAGLDESLRSGVTLIGDIATSGWRLEDYTAGPTTVLFQEVLGLAAARQDALLALTESHLQRKTSLGIPVGLSPHAPYSIPWETARKVVSAGVGAHVPVAIHLAETAAERELLLQGAGEFRELLTDFGLWRPELFGKQSIADWLELLAETDRGLAIHGNELTLDELAFLARHPHVTLVYCPRTHAAFGHSPHRWRDLIAMGGSVAIGTDSRASNPDLSLWAELQFLQQQHPDVPATDLVVLGTHSGARALGFGRDRGSLGIGKRADFAVVRLNSANTNRIEETLLEPEQAIAGTVLAGEWHYHDADLGARLPAASSRSTSYIGL